MSIRLHVIVEGETEERFVKNVLSSYLGERGVWASARRVLTSRNRRRGLEYRGGFRRTGAYSTVQADICTWMKQDRNPEARFTTMFDLYGLPNDFPGTSEAAVEADPYRRVAVLEEALGADIRQERGNDNRFVPYIQLHEFEALILADPRRLDWEFLEHDEPIRRLTEMVEREGGNPELIDDGPTTAPSKRIIAEISEYANRKATAGPLVVEKIGMAALLRRCGHFREWVQKLENLTAG
ncbi:MAG: DUF4276 family protein [Desulfococcaceae bacterium]